MITRPQKTFWRRWIEGWVATFTFGSMFWTVFMVLPQQTRRLFAGLTSPWGDIGYAVVILLNIGVFFPLWTSFILEAHPRIVEYLRRRADIFGSTVDSDENAA